MVDYAGIFNEFVEDTECGDFGQETPGTVFASTPYKEEQGLSLCLSLRSRIVESLQAGTTIFKRQRYHRERHVVAHCRLDHYLLKVVTSGMARGDVHGMDASASIGDVCIFDLAQTPMRDAEAGECLSVALPRRLLEKAAGASLHGTVLQANWPMTPLISAYVRGLCALTAQLPDEQAVAAQEAVVTLLLAALKAHGDGEAAEATPQVTGLRQRIVDFIARNIYVMELSPEFLCRRFHVSRAHLYRAFAQDGGVAKVLRDARLDAAYGELTQTAHAPRSITEIAYRLGFSSSNQLLRSFRSRFGVTPSEARARHAADTKDHRRNARQASLPPLARKSA